MKKILYSAVLVLLFTNLSFAQTQPIYFGNTIIVKYEDEESLKKTNHDGVQVVQRQVEGYLNSFDITEIKPIWNSNLENQLRKTLSEKLKSFVNEDLTSDLRRITEYRYSANVDPMILARKISSMPGVEYAEPMLIRMTQDILETNDPVKNAFVSVHKFEEAWDITTGSSDVIIGIVDSGVNYWNVDMQTNGWVNEDEIPNNGVDDDQNDFVDDYLGWDFWEAGGFNSQPFVEDNDPFSENNDHGAHVAGIATAEGNNGVGLVGSGFESRYMAVKTGGIQDNPNTEIDESRSQIGYPGIIYAVANGADIVNCSWGGYGSSSAEEDVINFALDAGVVVIAAAGNENTSEPLFPASYDGVLNVGSITFEEERSSFSNYGYSVDVFAVGSGVVSSAGFDSTSFLVKSGTSMASPVVAGLAGLLKAQYPEWSPRRIIHQIRSTSTSANFNSPLDPLFLGKGIVDAQAALTDLKPGLSIRNFDITDSEGSSLSVGESGIVEISLTNFGATTSSLVVTLESVQEEITVTSDPIAVGELATDGSVNVELEFDIPSNYDLNIPPTFVLRFEDTDNSYTDFDVFQFDNLSFGVMNANNITMSFSANGTIGVSDPSAATGGVGFIPEGFSNILYEGGIMMMAGGNPFLGEEPQLSNNVRATNLYDNDFDPNIAFIVNTPGEEATAQGTGTFVPNRFGEVKGVNVRLNTFAFDNAEVENAVYSQYRIKNNTEETIEEFYFGIFTDWDVNNFANNNVIYDPTNEFMYIYDGTDGNTYPYVTVDPMQGASAHHAIDNAYAGNPSTYRFNIYDGYSDEEKMNSLRAFENATGAAGSDVSTVVASGPYSIGPGVTIEMGFIYVYGSDYTDLRTKVLAARNKDVFSVDQPGVYTSSEFESDVPLFTKLSQNYPNPFNPSTELNFELAESGLTEISIYNILGQKVQTLMNEVKSAGRYSINFDAGRLNSGLYFAVLKSGDFSQSIKMTLIK